MVHPLFVRKNGRFVKIQLDDIQYAEAAGSYLKLVTHNDEFSLAQNLSQFIRKNPQTKMLRIHRSYLVNLDQIDSFDQSHIFIGSRELPIGASYRSQFLKMIHCI
jgi:DNA-binding LytR/AlgR family response regulator